MHMSVCAGSVCECVYVCVRACVCGCLCVCVSVSVLPFAVHHASASFASGRFEIDEAPHWLSICRQGPQVRRQSLTMTSAAELADIRKTSLRLHRHAAIVHAHVSNALHNINKCLPEGHHEDMINLPYTVSNGLQEARSALSKSLKGLIIIGTTNTELRTKSTMVLQTFTRTIQKANRKKSTARSAANTLRQQSRCTEPWRQMFAEWKKANNWSSPLYPKRDTPQCPAAFANVSADQLPMLAHCVFRYASLQEFRVQWRAKQAN